LLPTLACNLGSAIIFVKSIYDIGVIHMVNICTLDLNLLKVLDALLSEVQVSAAARALNLSQPATSAALARLRAALQDPLLVRAGNRMLLSPLAERLRPTVRRILQDIEQALRASDDFDPTKSQRCFRILANDYAISVVLSPLLEALQRNAPRVTFEILPLEDHFPQRLAADDYDLAIRDGWALRSSRRLQTLFKEEYVVIARRDHPRLSSQPTLEQFLAEGHVLISPSGRVPGVVDTPLKTLKRQRRVAVALPHFLAGPAIVARTDFVMTIPSRIAHKLSELHALRICPPPLRVPGFDVAMA
jgi:DNA-binding transcriptional LysR family regulator